MAPTVDHHDQLSALWARIRALNALVEGTDPSEFFLPGASESEVRAIERDLGVSFPEELRMSIRIHRQVTEAWESCDFLPFEYMKAYFDGFNQYLTTLPPMRTLEKVRPPVFGPKLLPFAYGPELAYCVDLDPAEGGVAGQIVAVDFDHSTCGVVADSLADFLRHGIKVLEDTVAKRGSKRG